MTRHLAYRSSARLSIERLREDTPAACERGRNAAGRRQGGARSTDPRVPSSTGAGPARARNRPSRGGAQSDVDPWEDRPSDFPAGAEREARRLAATTGANARIWLDVGRPIDFSPGGGAEVRAPDSTFVHELVHAVNITWGNYRIHISYPDPERRGAPSPEEEFAWLIENMYRSERRMWLRHRYLGERTRAPGTRSLGASLVEREVVELCWRKVRPLAQRLARIDARTCPYNPFREHARLAPGARP